MTNSFKKRNSFITPEKAAIILPTLISSIIALIFLAAFSIPKYVSSNKVNNELKEYKKRKARDESYWNLDDELFDDNGEN